MRKSSRLILVLLLLGPGCRKEPAPVPAPAPRADVRDGARPAQDTATRAASPPPAALPRGTVVTVLHSANLHGEYEAHPLGGLSRRASYGKQVRAEVDALVQVDAGDSLLPELTLTPGEPPPAPSEIERRAQLLLAGFGRLGLDAFTPGETDLALGAARLKALARKARVPILAANLIDKRGKHFFESHRMVESGGVRIGIFGVLTLAPGPTEALAKAGLSLTDAGGAGQGAASLLREMGAEVVVGLFHLAGGLQEARRVGDLLSAVDVMVLGHGAETLRAPELVAIAHDGATLMVEAFQRGKMLGRLDLHRVDGDTGFFPVDAAKGAKVPSPITGSWAAHQLVRMDPTIVSDDQMLALVKPYIEENRRRAARKLPVGLTARAGTRGELANGSDEGWTYASSSACAMCHKEEQEQFQSTAHAFALQTLERKGRERDPSCLPCHTTGFDRPGGTRNLQTAVSYFANVGCETCHGPSVAHIRSQNRTGTQRKVPEAVCRECHRPDQQIAPFDYAAAIKEVVGPGHGG